MHDYLRGVEHGGRVGVLYSNKDYGCEWDYDWRNKRFQREDNTRFAVNIVVYAMTSSSQALRFQRSIWHRVWLSPSAGGPEPWLTDTMRHQRIHSRLHHRACDCDRGCVRQDRSRRASRTREQAEAATRDERAQAWQRPPVTWAETPRPRQTRRRRGGRSR